MLPPPSWLLPVEIVWLPAISWILRKPLSGHVTIWMILCISRCMTYMNMNMRCIIYKSYESNFVSIDTHTIRHPRCTKLLCFFFSKSRCVCIPTGVYAFIYVMSTNIWENVYMLYMYVFLFWSMKVPPYIIYVRVSMHILDAHTCSKKEQSST